VTVTVTITLSNKPHEVLTEPDITKSLVVPRFEEETARIAEDLRLKKPRIVDFGRDFFHEQRGAWSQKVSKVQRGAGRKTGIKGGDFTARFDPR
jgi:hypothetical protein